MWYVIVGIVCLVAGFIVGILVYRNNANKFASIEAQAKAKGKSVEDVIKSI